LLFLGLGGPAAKEIRDLKTFLPRPGQEAAAPQGQVIQLLLDRQVREGQESYLIQVLFRGKPAAERVHRVLPDRVEIDFLDTGKPSMRLARIRGGVLQASSVDELHYRKGGKVKRLVRITLFTRARPPIRFRDTLDRTLILFRLPVADAQGKPAPAGTPASPVAPAENPVKNPG
jgi:hypothetical protein